ncbi:hypothetical protein [Chitinolyticbacter meiyuanensis]|uniref:hypothetical protein n=1 Tax=Chitinolyticbacter meiyuanensis TaxID=682798 RepID=UPI0011E5B821|nr:hypothetical protein [Chitinolyticbacter meiyuanensis]
MRANLSVLAATALTIIATAPSLAASHDELAYRHAPVHYQDTDNSDYASEYLTAFDYDGDWNGANNWDRRGNGLWPATVYYSVVESCSHHFISYAFYHPRDWSDTAFDNEHENDLEGAIIAVRKDGSTWGRVEGMITVFHNDFYAYTPVGSPLVNGNESIDGTLSLEQHNGVPRPKTAQEAKGHGLKAWPYITNFTGAANQDGVIYYPTQGNPEVPASGNDRAVAYRLVSMFAPGGLWPRALQEAGLPAAQAQTYASWGSFKGDGSGGCGSGLKSCSNNAANAPWGWDDRDDGASYRGEFALDPARLFAHYFKGASFSQQYPNNRFLSELRAAGWSSAHLPAGFDGKLNLDAAHARLIQRCE